jgi:heterodisulfide reductase subunit B
MKLAFFQGCNIPIRIEQYAVSTRAVLQRFGVELVIVPEFTCCGYPVRNVDEESYIMPSVRNLAIAEKMGLDIMVICNCCFASLQKARSVLADNPQLAGKINRLLAREDLHYAGTGEVKHFLTVLHDDIGGDTIKKQLVNQFSGLDLALILGCHILRPREVTRFDDSFVPAITDDLVRLTGATCLDWQGRLECCGAALAGLNNDVADRLLNEKVNGARAAGAAFMVPICAYCHLQFDTNQLQVRAGGPDYEILPVLLYPQLLGLCLGIDEKILGIEQNSTVNDRVLDQLRGLLGPPVEDKKKKRRSAKPGTTNE